MAAFSVWAPFTFSKALIEFSKELLLKKILAQKKIFFIATWFLRSLLLRLGVLGQKK